MAVCVLGVLVFSNLAVSLLRGVMPRSIRLILEMTLIASAVIVADEVLKAYAPDVSTILSVFVGLIITNCIVLGRAEAFAMRHGPLDSIADALGNGAAYGIILLFVATLRELFGSGTLLDRPVFSNAEWFEPNEMMLYAPSAFFIIGFVVWGVRSWRTEQAEPVPAGTPGERSDPGAHGDAERPRHLRYEVGG
jgi:Na+-transporting NADH:ubiquinone oxidoreductase subunit D